MGTSQGRPLCGERIVIVFSMLHAASRKEAVAGDSTSSP